MEVLELLLLNISEAIPISNFCIHGFHAYKQNWIWGEDTRILQKKRMSMTNMSLRW